MAEYTAKDFATVAPPKWCPGCGSYSIISQVQQVLPQLGVKREDVAFISGIGCSSRFTYYMNTFGMHTIHGRAPGIASGLKISRPELNVWLITGDGDCLSIGGNHFIHMLRRNPDINVVLFNNQIYGLTKGQYSPTTPVGTITKSSPYGSLDQPFNPPALALGAGGTFIARGLDRNPKKLQEVLLEGARHKGTAFTEVYMNCVVFNDKCFDKLSAKDLHDELVILLEEGQPLIYSGGTKGIVLEDGVPVIVDTAAVAPEKLWIHDPYDRVKAHALCHFTDTPDKNGKILPVPFGVFYKEKRHTYEELVESQIAAVTAASGEDTTLDNLLHKGTTWTL